MYKIIVSVFLAVFGMTTGLFAVSTASTTSKGVTTGAGLLPDSNIAVSAQGSNTKEQEPTFSDFSATVSKNKLNKVDLTSHPDARMFRTRLQNKIGESANFAGRYIVTFWGCGTSCQMGAIIDVETGRVFFPEELNVLENVGFGDEPYITDVEYRKDSSLFIIKGVAGNTDKPGTTWLLWEGDRFEQLAFRESGKVKR